MKSTGRDVGLCGKGVVAESVRVFPKRHGSGATRRSARLSSGEDPDVALLDLLTQVTALDSAVAFFFWFFVRGASPD